MAIPFGHRIEPLVDHYLINNIHGLSFRYTEPQNRGEALIFDQPWDNPGGCVHSIVEDEENVKLYYRGLKKKPFEEYSEENPGVVQLAVSHDGFHFEPYPVNELDYKGIKENNIISITTSLAVGQYPAPVTAPFYDTNPACKPDERYKSITTWLSDAGQFKYGAFLSASPDGIHWHKLSDEPAVTKGQLDSIPFAFWDPHAKLYRLYTRYLDNHGAYSDEWGKGIRAIQSCVSTDFIHWSEPVVNQYAEPVADHLYTSSVLPIPGAEHILICRCMRFCPNRSAPLTEKEWSEWRYVESERMGVSDAVFMTSRDGVNWDRTIKDAWIPAGTYYHEWTCRNMVIPGGMIERGDDFIFYVFKNYMWDDEVLYAYSVPRYRFMYLYADGSGGEFETKPLHFLSDDIYLNFSTSAYGSVKVTVLNEDGSERFESDELYGNDFSRRLHIDQLNGTLGRLRITMKEARLYAVGSDMSRKLK